MDKKEAERIIQKIKEFKKKIGVEKIIIFGSFARGEFKEDSDIDLILIGKKFRGKDPFKRSKGLWLKWDLGLPVDFLCYTPEEFEELKKKVSIVSEAVREGIEV
jgi:predicted nucleotidyltransferase